MDPTVAALDTSVAESRRAAKAGAALVAGGRLGRLELLAQTLHIVTGADGASKVSLLNPTPEYLGSPLYLRVCRTPATRNHDRLGTTALDPMVDCSNLLLSRRQGLGESPLRPGRCTCAFNYLARVRNYRDGDTSRRASPLRSRIGVSSKFPRHGLSRTCL